MEELRELIGCKYIDVIEFSPTKSMIIDDEARLANKNANDFATNLLRIATRQNIIIPILGNVVIVNNSSI